MPSAYDTTLRCASSKCNTALTHSYSVHTVNAIERYTETAPDGGSHSVSPRSLVTCSWRCLANAVTEMLESNPGMEPLLEEDPF